MAGVVKEIWTGEVEKKYRGEMSGRHLEKMRDYSPRVAFVGGAAVINLAEIGVDPNVLVDNNIYPIATASRTDSNIPLTLKKLETENTEVSDDELYGLSYDKIGATIDQHGEVLVEKSVALANYLFAPDVSTPNTPVLITTGAFRPGTNFRKMRIEDIIDLKRKFDKLKIPKKDRRLVLCPDHMGDLLEVNESFSAQYKNVRTGEVLRLYGFDIYEEVDMPYYTWNALLSIFQRFLFGSILIGTESQASVAYYAGNAWKAEVKPKMYYSKAEEDAERRTNIIGFRKHFCAAPITQRGYAAIVDGIV